MYNNLPKIFFVKYFNIFCVDELLKKNKIFKFNLQGIRLIRLLLVSILIQKKNFIITVIYYFSLILCLLCYIVSDLLFYLAASEFGFPFSFCLEPFAGLGSEPKKFAISMAKKKKNLF